MPGCYKNILWPRRRSDSGVCVATTLTIAICWTLMSNHFRTGTFTWVFWTLYLVTLNHKWSLLLTIRGFWTRYFVFIFYFNFDFWKKNTHSYWLSGSNETKRIKTIYLEIPQKMSQRALKISILNLSKQLNDAIDLRTNKNLRKKVLTKWIGTRLKFKVHHKQRWS